MVLVYGALSSSWLRDRNPEMYKENERLYLQKIAEMKAKIEDSLDMPRIEVADDYMAYKRNSRKRYY